jgi:hypothetical protein
VNHRDQAEGKRSERLTDIEAAWVLTAETLGPFEMLDGQRR